MHDNEEWIIAEPGYDIHQIEKYETLFALGNGNLGLRGDFEEKAPAFHRGTYINGFFEKEPIAYGETAYGYAENHETILNLPDAKIITISVGGEEFLLDRAQLQSYERYLDLRNGVLFRSVRAMLSNRALIELRSTRLVSLERESIGAIRYEARVIATPDGKPVPVRLESRLEGVATNREGGSDPRVGSKITRAAYSITRLERYESEAGLLIATNNSGLIATAQVRHAFHGPKAMALSASAGASATVQRWEGTMAPGERIVLIKYMAYRMARAGEEDALWTSAHEELLGASRDGFEELQREQREFLADFWNCADVILESGSNVQQALRFNLFHVLQSSGRNGKTSIAAKGLTGEGYEGHYFWDTEIYVCPFFTYTNPEFARMLLEYRYSLLEKARLRAKVMAEKGALFPWRTIDGEETSAYYPAGTAQYHIDADIAYAMEKYCGATGDAEFLYGPAAEVAVETARLWESLGHYGDDGRFRIDEVTGPDEYTALVNNNAYTNLMARNNLRFAARVLRAMREARQDSFESLRRKTALEDGEIEEWQKAADSMYVPYDPKTGIYAQDDSFMRKEVWPFSETPPDKYPLLLHFHPLVIYRHQVLKQPDLVLAQFLLSEQFTLAEKKRNFKFYEPLTTGDSSLSHCVQSIMASETGHGEAALDYFMKTVRMDLDNRHGNSRDGIHTAAMAGSWLSVVYGFAGFRDRTADESGAGYSFNPRLPAGWRRLAFKVRFGSERLCIDIGMKEVRYSLEDIPREDIVADTRADRGVRLPATLTFLHKKQKVTLRAGESVVLSLIPTLKAAILDLDGVVTDTARYHYLAWKRLADDNGWHVDERLNERLKGVARMEALEVILGHNGVSLSAEKKHELAERKNGYYRELLTQISPADILPGMKSLLIGLGQRGVKRILASASRNAPTIIDSLGLGPIPGQFLDGIADPNEVACGKPDPELFLLAADIAGASPEECVGIEDSLAGIRAIKDSGMKALGVGPGLEDSDLSVGSTSEITIDTLERLIQAGE
jgi:alpha,alpha-trehalose phosphorylase